jgi:SAM-dependent methyltransferase
LLVASLLRRLLAYPSTASLDLDDPATTQLRQHIIGSKAFLHAIYDEWYSLLAAALPSDDGEVLEVGSGAGFCSQFIPGLITSDIFFCPGVKMVVNATKLPFRKNSLRAIVMTNVLHHIPDVREFFGETSFCLRPGGKILMIEPWVSSWSRFVYTHLHHEPFEPDASQWAFPTSGPLSGANIALPWILFERDRAKFLSEFPQFAVEQIRPFLPFRYLVSGGVAMRSLVPGFTHAAWARLERALHSHMSRLGMFALISLVNCAHNS